MHALTSAVPYEAIGFGDGSSVDHVTVIEVMSEPVDRWICSGVTGVWQQSKWHRSAHMT